MFRQFVEAQSGAMEKLTKALMTQRTQSNTKEEDSKKKLQESTPFRNQRFKNQRSGPTGPPRGTNGGAKTTDKSVAGAKQREGRPTAAPSKNRPCWYCKSTEHWVAACPEPGAQEYMMGRLSGMEEVLGTLNERGLSTGPAAQLNNH